MEIGSSTFWRSILDEIALVLEKGAVSTWLAQTSLLQVNDQQLVIACPSPYAKNMIESRYQKVLKKVLQKRLGKNLQLLFKTSRPVNNTISGPLFDQLPDGDPGNAPYQETFSGKQPELSIDNLNPNYTFDNFVVGNSNRVAHSAALAVSEKPGSLYNPLFIYGGTGVGKTHLLHAIGNDLLKNHQIGGLYFPAEQFLNDFVSFIQHKKDMSAFKKKYRSQGVVLVDDFQFMGGKEGTQEEFFHTFNALQSQKKQIVIASDQLPKDIAKLTQRLVSRLSGGLVVDITAPDFETRLAILRAKSTELGLSAAPEILNYIAGKITSNVRELEGTLLKIKAQLVAQNLSLTMGFVKGVLQDSVLPASFTPRATPELLLNLISQTFNTSMRELCGKKRKKEIVMPRQVAMFMLRNEIGLNFAEIGNILGGRDHTTIMHGCDKISQALKNGDQFLRLSVKGIRQDLYPVKS